MLSGNRRTQNTFEKYSPETGEYKILLKNTLRKQENTKYF
jgi:hypothetical protein